MNREHVGIINPKWGCFLLLCLGAVPLILFLGWRFSWSQPEAIFAQHEHEFVAMAQSIQAGQAKKKPQEEDFSVPQSLDSVGVQHIRTEDGCIRFILASMPPDAIVEIIYCPTGYEGLKAWRSWNNGKKIWELKHLNKQWFYVQHD